MSDRDIMATHDILIERAASIQDADMSTWTRIDATMTRSECFQAILGVSSSEASQLAYQGMKLSSVPYKDIEIGLELISAIGTPGRIKEKINKEDWPHRENDNWLVVDWDNGKQSTNLHCFFDHVTVK